MAFNSEQLSADLLLQIDRLRGNTPREDFLRSLVREGDPFPAAYNGQPAAYPSLPPGIDRREFDDFRHEMRAILKDLIDYVVPSEAELSATAPPTPPEKGRLRRAVAARLGRKDKVTSTTVDETPSPEVESDTMAEQEGETGAKSPRLRIYYGKPGHPGSRVEEVTPVKHSSSTKATSTPEAALEAAPEQTGSKGEDTKLDKIVTLLEQVLTRPGKEEVTTPAKAPVEEETPDLAGADVRPRSKSRDRRYRHDRRRVQLEDDYDDEPEREPRRRGYRRYQDDDDWESPYAYDPRNLVAPYPETDDRHQYQPRYRNHQPDTVITATLDSISRNLSHLNRKMTTLEQKRQINTPPLPPLPPIYRYLDVPAEHLADPVAYEPPDDPFTMEQMAEEIELLTPPWARRRQALPEPRPSSMGAHLNRRVSDSQQLQLQEPQGDEVHRQARTQEAASRPEPVGQEQPARMVPGTVAPNGRVQTTGFPQELEQSYQRELAQVQEAQALSQEQEAALGPEATEIPDDGIFMPGSNDAPREDLDTLRAQLESGGSTAAVQREPKPQPIQPVPMATAEPEDGIYMPGSMGGQKGDLNGLRAQLEAGVGSSPTPQSQESPPASKEAKPPEADGAAQEYPENGIIMPGNPGNSSGGSDNPTNGPSKNRANGGSASSLNGQGQANGSGYHNANGNGNANGGTEPNGAKTLNHPSSDPDHNSAGNLHGHPYPGDPSMQYAPTAPGPSAYPDTYDPSLSPPSPITPSDPRTDQAVPDPTASADQHPDLNYTENEQHAQALTYPGTNQEYYEPLDDVDSFIQALRSSGQPLRLENARPVEKTKSHRTKRLPAPKVERQVTPPEVKQIALPPPEPEPEPQPGTRTPPSEPSGNENDALAEFEAQMSSKRRSRPRVSAEVEFDYQEPNESDLDEDYDDDEYSDADDLAPPDEEVNLPPWKTQFDFLWLGAVLLFGIGDVVSTWWAIQNGAQEANPFLHNIVHDNFMVFILIKVILLGVAFLYSYVILMENGHDARFMPAVFILAGAYLVVNNYQVTKGLMETNSGTFSNLIMSII